MKPRTHIFQCLLAVLLPAAAVSPLPLFAEPPPQPTKQEIPPSIFVIPKNASEGLDPFFTGSTRVFNANPENQNLGPSLTDLTLKSILGTPPHVFAIINNHTFAAGDNGDVITKDGRRLHIRCLDINPKAGTATIESGGTSVTLVFSGGL
jgi:hypothetical protein